MDPWHDGFVYQASGVRRCKIFQSHSCGVRVTDKGKGLLTQNEIYECQVLT
ncbi:hypothetical protein T484DRAFT_1790201 [Baffinella frigidus]|nr:hypothetical protein T484DRAFT_1790201 [Cryptophyta sp. CCMP2293]